MKLRRTRRPCRLIPFIRTGGILVAVSVIAGGVAYAALQSQPVKLSGNTIQTATADLLLSADGVNYGASQPGFVFGQLVPGGAAVPAAGNPVFLKNTGGTPLSLLLSVSSLPANLDSVDLSKVHVILSPTAGGSVQNFTLQGLIAAATTGG